MIAPLRLPDPWVPEKVRVLRKARRIVAAMLLDPPPLSVPEQPKIAAWKAWLFAGWVLSVVVIYLWAMLRT